MIAKDLEKLVKTIAPNWKGVGLELGLDIEDIDIIAANNPTLCEKACEEMLFKWYKKNPQLNIGMLIKAMETCKAGSGSFQINRLFMVYNIMV